VSGRLADTERDELRTSELVEQARREAGLTQMELAERVGMTLWKLERLERGEDDAAEHAPALAHATGKPVSWFAASDGRGEAAAPAAEERRPGRRRFRPRGSRLVLAALTLMVVIRLFTEVVPVLPRAANFIDVLLFLTLLGAALSRPSDHAALERENTPYYVVAAGFVVLCALSSFANLERVEPGPVMLFIYGFLAPVAFYFATYRLWPVGNALSLSRLLVGLGVAQFFVVFLVDLPRFVPTQNPDEISGTFGENAYQLVFFLIVFASLVAGIATFESGTLTARLAIPAIGFCFVVIFLAQYRALLVTTALSVLAVGILLSTVRGKGILVGAVILVLSFSALAYVASRYPVTGFKPTISAIRANPGYFASARLQVGRAVVDAYADEPHAVLTGTGPGTFSSRAWRTFADYKSRSQSNVAGTYVSRLTGGRVYETDISARYLLPRYRQAGTVLGSKALAQPFSSYFALLAEVGIIGFLLIVGLYLGALVTAVRMTVTSMRARVPRDPLPAVLLAATIAFFVLAQMAFLENWWEVTRVTVPAWMLLAVATKEFRARFAPQG
jgi:transcriptional regulator with XRE-family HTH domain